MVRLAATVGGVGAAGLIGIILFRSRKAIVAALGKVTMREAAWAGAGAGLVGLSLLSNKGGRMALRFPFLHAHPVPLATASMKVVLGVAPDYPSTRHQLLSIARMVCGLMGLDILVASRTKARWMCLHTMANFFVVVHALRDLGSTIYDPINCLNGNLSALPVCWISAIHLYHMLVFRGLPIADWVHHLVFCGVICPMGVFFPSGPCQNAIAFFLSGFPGGVSYFLYCLQKHHYVEALFVKDWNARINVWIRAPGCLLVVAAGSCAQRYHPAPNSNAAAMAVIFSLTVLNGLYYMQEVVLNTGRKDITYTS